VSATEAAKSFGSLVDRVREERVSYVIERGGTPVARIGPVEQLSFTIADLRTWVATAPRVDEEYLRAVEGVVARHNRPRVRRNPWER
jgi:antitoxin (DNA-binding transcriptional repressor) of toxin-antitoxin stability system